MPAARPAIPAATTSAGPAPTRAASAGRGLGWGCGPAWASAASAWGANRPQVLRLPRRAHRPGPAGSLGAVPAAGETARTPRVQPGVPPVATRLPYFTANGKLQAR